ncbi:hypothetical protein DENSPDRAFT_934741 [Dentipellis sp. KUC8613]|nr:hypothetical protein DENSPDRAFT_934741 [Dentipellis sp. KUC8613]
MPSPWPARRLGCCPKLLRTPRARHPSAAVPHTHSRPQLPRHPRAPTRRPARPLAAAQRPHITAMCAHAAITHLVTPFRGLSPSATLAQAHGRPSAPTLPSHTPARPLRLSFSQPPSLLRHTPEWCHRHTPSLASVALPLRSITLSSRAVAPSHSLLSALHPRSAASPSRCRHPPRCILSCPAALSRAPWPALAVLWPPMAPYCSPPHPLDPLGPDRATPRRLAAPSGPSCGRLLPRHALSRSDAHMVPCCAVSGLCMGDISLLYDSRLF